MKFLVLCFVAFTFNALALEFNDVLPRVNVIKAYDDNFLVINRGLEDGIFKGDHIKLTNQNGYIARAICIKASMLISHWKVYRVVNPELLSFDDDYKLKSMNQSKVPTALAEFREADFSEYFNDITDADVKKPVKMQQDRIVKFDLSLDTKRDPIIREANKDETEQFMDRNFDAEQLAEDFQNYNITIGMSPVAWQRLNDQKSINYSLGIENAGEKYELAFNFAKTETKVVDDFSGTEVTGESTEAAIVFDINRITKSISYFMFLSYSQMREGKIFAPRTAVQGGILGLKFHLTEPGEIVQKFDISYITIIDYMENDVEREKEQGVDEFGDPLLVPFIDIETRRRARHSFRLRLNANLSETLNFNSVLWYKPVMILETQEIDWKDTQTEWTTTLSWALTEKLSASYEFRYTYDIIRQIDSQIDPMNQENAINLNYTFEL